MNTNIQQHKFFKHYPWRCLCRASLHMTRIVPLRFMTLQLRQIRLTDALTFITNSKNYHNNPGSFPPLKLAFFINESYC